MKVTGIILAGGLGRRMGGLDKGLLPLRGKPLVAHVIDRLAPQVDELLINANRNLEDYAHYGYRVVPDAVAGYAGPLAGLQRGLSEAAHPLVVTAPCDSPYLPADLVTRLHAALEAKQADLAVAVAQGRQQPVFCLCRRTLLPHLTAFLDNGGRKIDAWYATLEVAEAPFDDCPDAFMNINTLQQLQSEKEAPA
ncbi:MAG: molybdenum cofactor guanylyltransferase [Methylophilaceae bacterium]|nr:molybdenum cofactor guanylyltransferase [Methylophilaceae bacterium]